MRWKFKPEPNPKKVAVLAKVLQIDTTLAKLLVQRGIETFEQAKDFFRPNLQNLHDPFLMKDMDKAVNRINTALQNDENILIYGDYDVDGTTSVALVSTYLKQFHKHIATYIPDRDSEGYGISYRGIDYADEHNISLVIALDCGIKAVEKIQYARKKNIDFIICDHHTPGAKLPEAVAVLDPKRTDCPYPYKELSGCGVGFKLIQALHEQKGHSVEELRPYLELVTTSIAADIVPITGENRILAYHGLQVINNNPGTGMAALKNTIEKKNLNITDVVFGIAPQINAAGRLMHADFALKVLTCDKAEEAQKFAFQIHQINEERKDLDKKITREALLQIENENDENRYTNVVFQPHWHKGVIGIVASRIIETHYKPTVVFTRKKDVLVGSARSVRGFNLYQSLEACDDYILQWGGHKYAAGLSLKPENYEAFKNCFEKTVKERIKPEQRTRELHIDAEIFLSEISMKFYRIIQQMAPFGPGNMHPVFAASGLRDNGLSRRVGTDSSHLKLHIIEGANPKTYPGIGFGLGDLFPLLQAPFRAAFTLDINEWQGNKSLQLKVKDLQKDPS